MRTVSLPLGEIILDSKSRLATGRPVASFFHYWVARILEFENLDLRRGPSVIVDAFMAEVRIQIRQLLHRTKQN